MAEREWATEADLALVSGHMQLVNTVIVDMEALPRAIDTVEHADAMGAFLDPTAWRDGIDARRQSLKLMRALNEYRNVVLEMARETGQDLPSRSA